MKSRLSEEDVKKISLMSDEELKAYVKDTYAIGLGTINMFFAFRESSKMQNEYDAYSRLMRAVAACNKD